jgi:hypothetical protein
MMGQDPSYDAPSYDAPSYDAGQTTAKQYPVTDQAFEWDDRKAAGNWRRHAVTFEAARLACQDYFAVERVDDGQIA